MERAVSSAVAHCGRGLAGGRARRSVALALCAVLTCGVGLHASAAETKLRLLSGFDSANPSTLTADAFAAAIAARTGGEYTIARSGPEVVPTLEQLEPASKGVFNLLFTTGGYHGNRTGVGLVVDTLKVDLDLRYSSGLFDWLDRYYQKNHNLKLVSLSSGSPYQFLLREPVGADGGLKGRKIRGIPNYAGLIGALGAAMVSLPPTQIYSSLEKGVIDGAAFPQTAATQYKLQEVIKYMAEPTFGSTHIMIFVNLDTWKTFPADVQKVFMEEGRKTADLYTKYNWRNAEIEVAALKKAGVRVTNFSPTYARQIRKLYNEGVWGTAYKAHEASAREMRAFVDSKRLLNE